MKSTLLTLSLLMSFQTVFAADSAGQFKFTEKECRDLAKELSNDAFEAEKALDAKKISGRFSAEILKYLDHSKTSFAKDLNQLCDKKKDNATFDDIYKVESTCKETCKENLVHIKKPMFKIVKDLNRTEEKSEAACFAVCDKNQSKLDAMKRGLTMAMKSKASPDCSGMVSDSGRNKIKPIMSDLDKLSTEVSKKAVQK